MRAGNVLQSSDGVTENAIVDLSGDGRLLRIGQRNVQSLDNGFYSETEHDDGEENDGDGRRKEDLLKPEAIAYDDDKGEGDGAAQSTVGNRKLIDPSDSTTMLESVGESR